MSPELITAIVSAGGTLIALAAKFISSPDPVAVLAEMRAELAKMQAALGEGGTMELALAAHNATLDAAIAAEKAKQAAPNPTVVSEPEPLPAVPGDPENPEC